MVRALLLVDGVDELRFHECGRHPVAAGLVVHLAQVGPVAQPPRPRQFPLRARPHRWRSPPRPKTMTAPSSAAGPSPTRSCLDGPAPSSTIRSRVWAFLADGLGTQEDRDYGLLDLPVCQAGGLVLNCATLLQLAFENGPPLLGPAGVGIDAGRGSEVARRLGQTLLDRALAERRSAPRAGWCPTRRHRARRSRRCAGCRGCVGSLRVGSSGCRRSR